MSKRIGKRSFQITITDQDIIKAGNRWKVDTPHEDAPEMEEAVRLRVILGLITKQDTSMLCPLWLRNRFVQLRKASLLGRKSGSL